jgi:hypothetical protein
VLPWPNISQLSLDIIIAQAFSNLLITVAEYGAIYFSRNLDHPVAGYHSIIRTSLRETTTHSNHFI